VGICLNLDGTETADLVLCLEVAEHIDPQYCDLIVQSVYNTIAPGGQLIWTAAQPGQGGVGHINNRKRSFWLDKFTAAGLVQDDVEQDLVDYCRQGYHMGWFVNNVIVLKKDK
jgi:2-polyprenyl-3-methyl-5-hydroxy-6-metoxy-1,4-benzoquinol methylase